MTGIGLLQLLRSWGKQEATSARKVDASPSSPRAESVEMERRQRCWHME